MSLSSIIRIVQFQCSVSKLNIDFVSEKERRHRRPARPVSPGYSTDSNYGSIDMVHKPYPKSERKKQLLEQGVYSSFSEEKN